MDTAKQLKFDISYMEMAHVWAVNSECKRKQVGSIVVRDNMIISDGFNGTPPGMNNCCEDENGETLWYVIHAELNAIGKLAQSNNSSKGATIYTTLSPCRDCCKLILKVGIVRVVYDVEHSDTTGLDMLRNAGVIVNQIKINK